MLLGGVPGGRGPGEGKTDRAGEAADSGRPRPPPPPCRPAAYKEKMKELSVLSLICSCFYSQPHPNTIYQYGGECARGPPSAF